MSLASQPTTAKEQRKCQHYTHHRHSVGTAWHPQHHVVGLEFPGLFGPPVHAVMPASSAIMNSLLLQRFRDDEEIIKKEEVTVVGMHTLQQEQYENEHEQLIRTNMIV
jgi:hypothetical protein